MKPFILIFILFTVGIALVDIQELPHKSKNTISLLDDDTIMPFLNDHRVSLIEVRAEWCNWCREFDDTFISLAHLFLREGDSVSCGVIYQEASPLFHANFEIKTWPSLLVFIDNKPVLYKGIKQLDSLYRFIRRIQHTVEEYPGIEALTSLPTDEVVIVYHFPPEEIDSLPFYTTMAADPSLHERFYFYFYSAVHFNDGNNNSPLPLGITLFRVTPHQELRTLKTIVINDPSSFSAEARSFIEKESLPKFAVITTETLPHYRLRNLPMVRIFVTDFKPNTFFSPEEWLSLERYATKMDDEILMGIFDKKNWKLDVEKFGLEPHDMPGLDPHMIQVVIEDTTHKKYKMKEPFSVDALIVFIENFLKKDVPYYLRTAKEPETQSNLAKNVIEVVGSTFEDVILNASRDVLVVFYSPHCGFCKKLDPVVEDLANAQEFRTILFAKIDATLNDAPEEFFIHGYPTLYFLPKGDHPPILYTGEGREYNDLAHFLQLAISDISQVENLKENKLPSCKVEL